MHLRNCCVGKKKKSFGGQALLRSSIFLGASEGQALLVTMLVMALALTLGMSAVSQSIIDVKMSVQEKQSMQALSAAEAGIEEALRLGAAPAQPIDVGGILATVTEEEKGVSPSVVLPGSSGFSKTIWLIDHDGDGVPVQARYYTKPTLDICWETTTPVTAMEVIVYYKNLAEEYLLGRGAYDPDGSGRRTLNGFSAPNPGDGCTALGLGVRHTINFSSDFGINPALSTLLYVRLRPVYGSTRVGAIAETGANLPSQGKCYTSRATASTGGGVTRRVQQCQFFDSPPGIFDYSLFSGGDLIK